MRSGLDESGENRLDVGTALGCGVLLTDDCLNVRFSGDHICVLGLIDEHAENRGGSAAVDRLGKGVTVPDSKHEMRWFRIALWS